MISSTLDSVASSNLSHLPEVSNTVSLQLSELLVVSDSLDSLESSKTVEVPDAAETHDSKLSKLSNSVQSEATSVEIAAA